MSAASSGIIKHTGSLFTPERAEALAAELNADDDWTYTPVHCPEGTGWSFVTIHDETGEYVGKL